MVRVHSWDARILDAELVKYFVQQIQKHFEVPIGFELDCCVEFFYLICSFIQRKTPGMAFRNLTYGYVAPLRAITTISTLVSLRLMQRQEKIGFFVQCLQLVNTLAFLKHGKYRCIVERAHQLVPTIENREIEPKIAYEYLNGQTMLNGLTESVGYLWPILNVGRLWIMQNVTRQQNTRSQQSSDQNCAKCSADTPEMAVRTSCGHIYCYYCLATSCAIDEKYCCVVCASFFDSSTRVAHSLGGLNLEKRNTEDSSSAF